MGMGMRQHLHHRQQQHQHQHQRETAKRILGRWRTTGTSGQEAPARAGGCGAQGNWDRLKGLYVHKTCTPPTL